MPLVYKHANQYQRQILYENYDVRPFNVKIISLERTFIDKLFAAQKYMIDLSEPKLAKPTELAKHLYDIAVLLREARIKVFLRNKDKVKRMEVIRRCEEERRAGGVPAHIRISDFALFTGDLDKMIVAAFEDMQYKYVLENKYKITTDMLKTALVNLAATLSEI